MKLKGLLITITAIITILLSTSCKSKDLNIEVKRWRAPRLVETLESGVKYYKGQVHFTNGPAMTVKVYEPVLKSIEKVPLVVIAPAGTPLVTGNNLGNSHSPEHLPYAENGIYVVAYELAGHVNNYDDIKQYREGIRLFTLFNAGIANGEAAIDYSLCPRSKY